MKYYTKNWYKKLQISSFLMFPETKQEWDDKISFYKDNDIDIKNIYKENLEEIKDDLLKFLPEFFHVYINNGTINSEYPSACLKTKIDEWIKEFNNENEKNHKEYNKHYNSIKNSLPKNVVKICEKNLHDSVVKSFEYVSNDVFVITLDTDNTFEYTKDIKITFTGVKDLIIPEKFKNLCCIYNELYITEDGFELDILLDSPLSEFKICAENLFIEEISK